MANWECIDLEVCAPQNLTLDEITFGDNYVEIFLSIPIVKV